LAPNLRPSTQGSVALISKKSSLQQFRTLSRFLPLLLRSGSKIANTAIRVVVSVYGLFADLGENVQGAFDSRLRYGVSLWTSGYLSGENFDLLYIVGKEEIFFYAIFWGLHFLASIVSLKNSFTTTQAVREWSLEARNRLHLFPGPVIKDLTGFRLCSNKFKRVVPLIMLQAWNTPQHA
jgi:hypothetical protein